MQTGLRFRSPALLIVLLCIGREEASRNQVISDCFDILLDVEIETRLGQWWVQPTVEEQPCRHVDHWRRSYVGIFQPGFSLRGHEGRVQGRVGWSRVKPLLWQIDQRYRPSRMSVDEVVKERRVHIPRFRWQSRQGR
ncbi:uncharacterized protein BT62DRAFT_762237 [Guyanagaster necrorhizus]|uniref:Secreted protein n=1 Tax=Guyanagaster necrorhizus TaxID=856835 RepID=A0A9P7VXH1_9AGAR|nr:uncharacterized protein BT62DRAFT_762237 [Guyanagaster necrorhizus MCA 3950]KAG7448260.1 hypothetical protein BT62DRAFT_762237 [Guyanagaster necrorhizus MCA 3950]